MLKNKIVSFTLIFVAATISGTFAGLSITGNFAKKVFEFSIVNSQRAEDQAMDTNLRQALFYLEAAEAGDMAKIIRLVCLNIAANQKRIELVESYQPVGYLQDLETVKKDAVARLKNLQNRGVCDEDI